MNCQIFSCGFNSGHALVNRRQRQQAPRLSAIFRFAGGCPHRGGIKIGVKGDRQAGFSAFAMLHQRDELLTSPHESRFQGLGFTCWIACGVLRTVDPLEAANTLLHLIATAPQQRLLWLVSADKISIGYEAKAAIGIFFRVYRSGTSIPLGVPISS